MKKNFGNMPKKSTNRHFKNLTFDTSDISFLILFPT